MPENELIISTSKHILQSFDNYISEFLEITQRAKWRFECRDWQGRHQDSVERFDLYERALTDIARQLERSMDGRLCQRQLWRHIKSEYQRLINGRPDSQVARTFYNSVTRKIFSTVGLDRNIEYFSQERPPFPDSPCNDIYACYLPHPRTADIIFQILCDHELGVPFDDIRRDSELVAREVDLYLWPILHFDNLPEFEVIKPIFYRNKAAYIIGRILADDHVFPLVLPMYNGEKGIYVDTVLLSESEVSIVFSFVYSYFHIDAVRKDALIAFLRSILPRKPLAELYSSIGFNRHGKTEFYRDLHRFVHVSHEKFVIAPGKEGAVMIVFTLPDFSFVLKVIKDRPCFLRSHESTPKTISISEVRAKYDLVCHRDRVGRMVDTQEFENLKFRRFRFSLKLIKEFMSAAQENVIVEKQFVVIRHLYVQRKVTPLPIYLQNEKDPEMIRRIIIDFGFFLKDLAASGIFPSDLFNTWNYGVTRQRRVVLFDYDDVMPLEAINFREKPIPRNEMQEMDLEENWIVAYMDDYFLDEIYKYTGIPRPLKAIFREVHGDLLTIKFWAEMKLRLRRGEIIDITPYDRSKRFSAPAAVLQETPR